MATKTNVLFLNKFREIGGSEVFLLELLSHLDRQLFHVVVAPIGETSDEARDLLRKQNVKIYPDLFHDTANQSVIDNDHLVGRLLGKVISPQGRRSPYDIGAVFRLAQILRQEEIDVLFYLDKHAALNLAPLAALLARPPIVVGSYHSPGLKLSPLERLLLPITDVVVSTSEYHKDYLLSMNIPPSKVEVINTSISTTRFEQSSSSIRPITKQDLGINPSRPLVAMVARLVPEKCHTVFLASAGKVLKTIPNVHFLVVGDGPERERLEQLSQQLGLSEHVHFLGFLRDIGELLSLCDISALSTCSDFLSISLQESMLLGLPVVATRVGAIPELVNDGETGFLVPSGDAEAFANAIITLLTDEELAQKMGSAGKERIVDVFSSRTMTSRYEVLMKQLMDKTR